jgi:hypothetical protein
MRILLVPALTPLYFYVSTFRSMCAVPNMAVFCSSLTLWFPGMLLTYFLNYFEMVPVAPIITGITFVFTFLMRCISIVRSLYFRIFSASVLITFLSPEIATSIKIHVLFSLSRIIMSGLLLEMVLSLWTYYYYYYYYYYLMQLSFHSVAVVPTLVQTKQIRINIHKQNNRKTQYKQYTTQWIHLPICPKHPHNCHNTTTYTHLHITK